MSSFSRFDLSSLSLSLSLPHPECGRRRAGEKFVWWRQNIITINTQRVRSFACTHNTRWTGHYGSVILRWLLIYARAPLFWVILRPSSQDVWCILTNSIQFSSFAMVKFNKLPITPRKLPAKHAVDHVRFEPFLHWNCHKRKIPNCPNNPSSFINPFDIPTIVPRRIPFISVLPVWSMCLTHSHHTHT